MTFALEQSVVPECINIYVLMNLLSIRDRLSAENAVGADVLLASVECSINKGYRQKLIVQMTFTLFIKY